MTHCEVFKPAHSFLSLHSFLMDNNIMLDSAKKHLKNSSMPHWSIIVGGEKGVMWFMTFANAKSVECVIIGPPVERKRQVNEDPV